MSTTIRCLTSTQNSVQWSSRRYNFIFGSISIIMKRYIQEAICFFDKDVSTEVSSPPNKKLYGVDPYSPTLPEKQSEYFRSNVANIYGQLQKHNHILKL